MHAIDSEMDGFPSSDFHGCPCVCAGQALKSCLMTGWSWGLSHEVYHCVEHWENSKMGLHPFPLGKGSEEAEWWLLGQVDLI